MDLIYRDSKARYGLRGARYEVRVAFKSEIRNCITRNAQPVTRNKEVKNTQIEKYAAKH